MSGRSTAMQIVLEDISIAIAPCSFVAIVGPSGCGKTTLLRMLLGEESPTQGRDSDRRQAAAPRTRRRPRRRLPALLGVPAFDGARECHDRLRVRGLAAPRPPVRRRAAQGDRRRARAARGRGPQGPREQISGAALRRHAAAARAGAGAHAEAESPSARRALRRARPRHPSRHPRSDAASSGTRPSSPC